MSETGPCAICGPGERARRWCIDCRMSYDRHARNDGSVMEAIVWAARRAKRYERKRAGEEKRESQRVKVRGGRQAMVMVEVHKNCGGLVVLKNEAWTCIKCGARPIAVTDVTKDKP